MGNPIPFSWSLHVTSLESSIFLIFSDRQIPPHCSGRKTSVLPPFSFRSLKTKTKGPHELEIVSKIQRLRYVNSRQQHTEWKLCNQMPMIIASPIYPTS